MKAHEAADQVDSKESFIAFVRLLETDWRNGRSEWENDNIGTFLEAMTAWAGDMGERLPATPTWRSFADLLMAAKIYE